MKKRIISAFALSILLPLIAFVVIAMKFKGEYRWHTAGILYCLGWLCLALAIRKHRRTRVLFERQRHALSTVLKDNARFIAIFLLTLLLIYLGRTLFPAESSRFIEADSEELKRLINADFEMVPVYVRGMDSAVSAMAQRADLFQGDIARLSPEDKTRLLELWSRYLAYSMELEKLKHVHKHFHQINFINYPELHLKSFLTAYSAFVANCRAAVKLTKLVDNNEFVGTFLNEQKPQHDIPANAYLYLKKAVIHPDTLVLLNIGRAHIKITRLGTKLSSEQAQFLKQYSEDGYLEIMKSLGKQPELIVETPKKLFEKHVFTAWMPLQKGVAKGMSLVRTTHRENFITLDDVQSTMRELEPGDILLERRNWYLTNIGIPGFWPHTALYTGTPLEIDEYFRDVELPDGLLPSEYISRNHPELFEEISGQTRKGHEFRVLEALRPGVIPTALEDSARADYLAVLRPRLDKKDKLKAILAAFSFYRRPYDYNFDFVTDNELVCSELIFKAYRPGENRKGIAFQLKETAGRLLLPPNSIAAKFAAEYGSDDAELDFVLFLDGSEEEGNAERGSVEDFLGSWQRPKWDVAQE
jgi:hypothetical protein